MQQIFARKIRFRNENGKHYPNWDERKLVDVGRLISGQHLAPNQYSEVEGNEPYFTGPSDFTNTIGEVTKWTTVDARYARCDDVLITVKGSGVGELWYLTIPTVAMGRQLMAIRTPDPFLSRLIYFYLGMRHQRHRFSALASGNMIPGLTRDDILDTCIPFPSPPECEKIATFFSTLESLIDSLVAEVQQMQLFRRALIQQLFV